MPNQREQDKPVRGRFGDATQDKQGTLESTSGHTAVVEASASKLRPGRAESYGRSSRSSSGLQRFA